MPYTRGSNLTSGFEIVVSNFEDFEKRFYDTKYPDIFWQKVIPAGSVETDIPEGATSTSYGVRDWSGTGAFDVSQSGSTPTVGLSVAKPVVIPILDASVGGFLTRADIRTYTHAHGGTLDTELSGVMKKASERHVEGTFFYGDGDVGFTGWMNEPNITVAQAFDNAALNSKKWIDKTPDEILKDINFYMAQIFTDSLQMHQANSVFIPTAQYADIATRRMGILETTITVLDYIKRSNLFTATTGQELNIMGIPHLKNAGAGGVVDRMVILQNDADYQKLPFPIPYRFLPPVPMGLQTNLFAEYKFGPYHNRWPASALYIDEI